jgi:hypothetical protein
MIKLLEIGELGVLRDIPSNLTILNKENSLLKQSISKMNFEKQMLVMGIVVLVIYILWVKIKEVKQKNLDSFRRSS